MRPLLLAALLLALSAGALLAGCASGEDGPADTAASPEEQAGGEVIGPGRTDSTAALGAAPDPQPAPSLQLTTTDGRTIDLANPEGVLVVNFWATWCGPCRIEIPDLIALQDELGPQGLTVVGVAVGEDEDIIQPFAETMEINYPLVTDMDRSISQAFGGVYGLPTTVVIDRDGQVVRRILGLFPTDRLRPRLEALVADAG